MVQPFLPGALNRTAGKDPRVEEQREKMKVVYHTEYPKRYFGGEGRMDIILTNGQTLSGAMDQPYGSPKYPLSMDRVVDIY